MATGDICPVCGRHVVPGYHHLLGYVLEAMCYKCHKKNGDSSDRFERHRSTIGNKGGARS